MYNRSTLYLDKQMTAGARHIQGHKLTQHVISNTPLPCTRLAAATGTVAGDGGPRRMTTALTR